MMDLYRENPFSYKLTDEEQRAKDEINGDHKTEQPFEGALVKYFKIDNGQENDDWWMMTTTIIEHLNSVGVKTNNVNDNKLVGVALKSIGVERKQRRIDGVKTWGYQGIQMRKKVKVTIGKEEFEITGSNDRPDADFEELGI